MDGGVPCSAPPPPLIRMPLDLLPTCTSCLLRFCRVSARHPTLSQTLSTFHYRCFVDSSCTASSLTLDSFPNVCGTKYTGKRSCKLRTISNRLERDAFSREWISDVEFEILQFMDASETPMLFPTRSELINAGRNDLVDAILREGGWLLAGWDSESGINVEEKVHREAFRNDAQYTHAMAPGRLENVPEHTELGSQTRKPTKEEIRTGWERVADFLGLRRSPKKPGHGGKLPVDSNENGRGESSQQSISKMIHPVASLQLFENTVEDETVSSNTDGELGPLCSSSTNPMQQSHLMRQSRRKKRKRNIAPKDEIGDVTIERSVHRINDQIDKRNEWLNKVKLRACKDPHKLQQDANDVVSVSHRIRVLEAELSTTLNMLQRGRHTFALDIKVDDLISNRSGEVVDSDLDLVERGLLSNCEDMNNVQLTSTEGKHFRQEIEKASDELEFRETELLSKHRELREARAKLIASKGKLAFELTELRKNIEKKDKDLDRAVNILKTMRTTRIVWPNPASEVSLVGSFDGWTSQRKMEKSNAGVFVTSLQLYPGRYEIKFIVNGEWKVDPNRPTTNEGGHVNNVLIVI